MANNRVFTRVGGLRPGRSAFDLSYNVKMTADMGILYPVMCDEVIPGDYFRIGNTAVVRFQPLVAPILQEVNIYFHYFFVPYRILWSDWENYITGGVNGPQDAESEATLYASVPRWQPNSDAVGSTDDNAGKGSLWDYFGFPIMATAKNPAVLPLDFPRRAYNMIWNEYYRDENLMSEVEFNLDPRDDPSAISQVLLRRSWAKDYFTSATPWQQRGLSPALPVSFTLDQQINDLIPVNIYDRQAKAWRSQSQPDGTSYGTNGPVLGDYFMSFTSLEGGTSGRRNMAATDTNGAYDANLSSVNYDRSISSKRASFYIKGSDVGKVQTGDLVSTSFNISDLRLAFQIQKWMERNARAGVRYTEFLRAHYGVAPRDERLQRPEYIGGSKQPVVVSEVLQTSKTDGTQPLGQQGGKAMSVASQYCGKYHATEFGLIIGIMSVMPVASYSQGIDRQWIKETRYDFYSPEFANLSEQAIVNGELYVPSDGSQDSDDFNTIFGFQGRYDELRVKRDKCVSWMRPSSDASDVNFSYWHLSRFFSEQPLLNESFLECNPRKDVFAVQDEPCMILNVRNHIKAVRPIPIQSEPGLIDHH